MATSRSKALQLLVYMSRTNARGTSAFLHVINIMDHVVITEHLPAGEHSDVPPFLISILRRMREETIQARRKIMRSRSH